MILIAVLLAAVLIVPGSDHSAHATPQATPTHQQHGCTRTLAIVRQVLPELGGDPADWSMTTKHDAYAWTIPLGTTSSRVEVSTKTPCSVMPSVVHHEWMHQQQAHWFGWRRLFARDDLEIMADCGSWMLGSRYTPYIDQAREDGTAGCTSVIVDYARAIIEAAGVPIVRQP